MKKNQKGFVLTLPILMLVVMSIMGVTLVVVTSNDIKQNDNQEEYQQALYTAETAISLGKNWLENQVKTSSKLPQAQTTIWNSNLALPWCRPSRFSKVMTQTSYIVYAAPTIPEILLGDEMNKPIGGVPQDHLNKYNRYQIYYFITNAQKYNGNARDPNDPTITLSNKDPKFGTGLSSSGGSVGEKSTYKSVTSTGSAQEYTIYGCGRNKDTNVVAAIDVTVVLAMQ